MKTATAGPRVAILLSHPTQYYSPWFQSLSGRADLQIRVFYLWDFGVTVQEDPKFRTAFKWDIDLLSGYESEFVPNAAGNPGPESFWGFRNPGLGARLGAWKPDYLLLFGYKWFSHLQAVLWARLHSVPILFRGDSNLLSRPRPRLHVRLALRVLFSDFASFLYVGAANRDYFRTFGVPDHKLVFAPHSINGARFKPGDPAARHEVQRLKRALAIAEGTKVILFAGKFVEAKQPRALLEAYLELGPAGTALLFVGGGAEMGDLESRALSQPGKAGTAIHFLPFANQSEMPSRYLLADIFVLPSREESWGLAVNEAMQMGVPCLVSDRVGCQQDLVSPGETGWVFRFGVTGALRGTLAQACADVTDPTRAADLKAAVIRRISRYSYEQTTAGLLEAIRNVESRGRPGI